MPAFRNRFVFIVLLGMGLLPALIAYGQTPDSSAPALTQTTKNVEQPLLPGVVVEKVERNSAAEKAGLRKGDVLLSWSRGDEQGKIETPLDFFSVQAEQAPRGMMKLTGFRGQVSRTWTVDGELWDITTRPNLSVSMLSEYRSAKVLLSSGKAEQSYQRWISTINQIPGPSIQRAALFYEMVQQFIRASQWMQVDAALREALQNTAGQKQLEFFIYWEMAISFWARHDMASAAESCSSTMTRNLIPGTGLTNALFMLSCSQLAYAKGDLDTAQRYGETALPMWEKLAPHSTGNISNILQLGNIAFLRGDMENAEGYYTKATHFLTNNSSPHNIVVLYDGLGLVSYSRGDLSGAERYYHSVLAILKKDLPAEYDLQARNYCNLSLVAEVRGDLDKSELYARKALQLEESHSEDLFFIAVISRLGNLRRLRGDLAQAKRYLEQALAARTRILPGSLEMGWDLSDLGDVARDSGDLAKAEEYYNRALVIREKLAPDSIEHSDVLASLAHIAIKQQRINDAAILFERSIEVLEKHTARLGGSSDIRLEFRAKHLALYRDYIDLLASRNDPNLALDVLERSRARSLLEMLVTSHIDLRKAVVPILLTRERSLQTEMNAKSERRLRLMGEKHSDDALNSLNKEIAGISAQYQEVESEIRITSPAYAALTQPQPLTAKEVQAQLLDPNTLLLEYSLGEERSYVFAVTPDSLQAYELPKRADVEKAARRVYSLLTSRNANVKNETPAQKQTRLAKAESEYPRAAAELSKMILGPVAAQLQNKRLLVVTDGALAYIPFSALPEPAGADNSTVAGAKSAEPLIVNHEIVNLPSASVLAVLRQQEQSRKPAPNAVAVLADPVFESSDSRVNAAGKPLAASQQTRSGVHSRSIPGNTKDAWLDAPSSVGLLSRSASDIGLSRNGELQLPRLRFTRREANEIMAVTPARLGKKAVDFDASRAAATSPELSQYRIVHFATHGLLDSAHPELSGLVFSMVDKKGRPQNGFLELQDIYNLNLPADLVVLSACETGLGKEVSGEGLVGLTRGFMYAGASRVVASLWRVSDVGTAELMAAFYTSMEKDGLPPAAALRSAQIKLWKQKRWNNPYYWAAFQIQGEWK